MIPNPLPHALQQRILVLDGAMGTALDSEGCLEHWVLTKPEAIASVHRGHLEAGCDIIRTHTFGASPLQLHEYGLAHLACDINREAARLARAITDQFATSDKPRFVDGMGLEAGCEWGRFTGCLRSRNGK